MERQRTGTTSILGEWQSWFVLIVAAVAVLPSFLLASLYFVAFRVAFRVGHWPYLGNPDASAMPNDLQPGSGLLVLLVPLSVYVAMPAFLRLWSSDTAIAFGAFPFHC